MRSSRAALPTFAGILLAARCHCSQSKCSQSTFKAVLDSIPGTSINYIAEVPLNGSFGDAATNIPFPHNATGLPELCAASFNTKTPGDTSYNFGVFLPSQWNGRFLATGNGGLGGGINWIDMGIFSQYGFASMSTDTGHSSAATDGKWGLHQPEKLINWGYRAMHGSATATKEIVRSYYAEDIEFSYYASCSTGGRQGLREIQLHPDTFDGVVVGAPAWWTTHLQTWTVKQGLTNLPANSSHHVPSALFGAIADEMVRQCDAQDGVPDGIISDPDGCNFDFNRLLCSPGHKTACLTPSQIDTAERLYRNYLDTDQALVFPGMSLGASAAALSAQPSTLGVDFLRYWVFNDSSWDYTTFKYEDVLMAEKVNPGGATADDFDLSPFQSRGGKLIHYHGLADDLIPAGSSRHFYDQVYRTLVPKGIKVDEFYRFFFVPGMQHCMGSTVAPWYIGGGSQSVTGASHSVPGFMDPQHDVILAIMAWVESGKAPDKMIATKFRNDSALAGVESQRPLCTYPKQPRYLGHGGVNEASSWECIEINTTRMDQNSSANIITKLTGESELNSSFTTNIVS
ncbi:feruloyl esterase B precursor [Metarhizium acridum CQMa 102]|uniref:Carboxylic ester hydrolase n=1 Tax=Metarhizium acridum (strain CQMa 102) TaxID=655827 RepID=E9E6Z6_METAQ|nr:feruloyl esterase B precursor [Metarhizium acridum CQMa 102]EFY88291.1 feruloyl esterase B precursor [Metarhizium acridum CQMa 102]